jgi:NAD(P)-dependent dehydrogenase (short-subunit alcohol dehydrogenase family)
MGRVAGKVAFVAGAGGGIGGAAAQALAREGAAVFCTDRDGSAAEETAARIRAAGGRAAASALDCATAGRSTGPLPLWCANSAGSISCSNRLGPATGSIFWISIPTLTRAN